MLIYFTLIQLLQIALLIKIKYKSVNHSIKIIVLFYFKQMLYLLNRYLY